MAHEVQDVPSTTPPVKQRKFSFPSAFTVLFAVTILVWLLAFIIPTGTYRIDPAPKSIVLVPVLQLQKPDGSQVSIGVNEIVRFTGPVK